MLGIKPWFSPKPYLGIRMKNVVKGVYRLMQIKGAVL
jgi:hypothetical protein